jgi:hypothetical protein
MFIWSRGKAFLKKMVWVVNQSTSSAAIQSSPGLGVTSPDITNCFGKLERDTQAVELGTVH